MISSQGGAFEEGASILAEVKTISGRRIEERRRRRRISQKQLAADVGIGVRWLREIESGNPKARVDDHIACAHALGLSSAHLIIPMLFLEHNMHFPRHFFLDDMHQLEKLCVEFISNLSLKTFLQPGKGGQGQGSVGQAD